LQRLLDGGGDADHGAALAFEQGARGRQEGRAVVDDEAAQSHVASIPPAAAGRIPANWTFRSIRHSCSVETGPAVVPAVASETEPRSRG
jgi:hypothetical protein